LNAAADCGAGLVALSDQVQRALRAPRWVVRGTGDDRKLLAARQARKNRMVPRRSPSRRT